MPNGYVRIQFAVLCPLAQTAPDRATTRRYTCIGWTDTQWLQEVLAKLAGYRAERDAKRGNCTHVHIYGHTYVHVSVTTCVYSYTYTRL